MTQHQVKQSPAEVAALLDEVGDSFWYRLVRYFSGDFRYRKILFIGFAICMFLMIACGLFDVWLATALLVVLASTLLYFWQAPFFLKIKAEDAMVHLSEEELAKVVSLARFEDIAYDSIRFIRSRGRPELKSFEVIRKFEPDDIVQAQKEVKDLVVLKNLIEVEKEHERIEYSCATWGIFWAIIAGICQRVILSSIWPDLFVGESTQLRHWYPELFVPSAVGTIIYTRLRAKHNNEKEQLMGLQSSALKKLKRRDTQVETAEPQHEKQTKSQVSKKRPGKKKR